MKRIAFVVVWMGKLPDYFSLWLSSCKGNPSIDFLVFTDDDNRFDLPSNVKLVPMQFEEIKRRIQGLFDFTICLDRAYKMCDYKPVYGEAFCDYLKGYDFWGYCDVDLIWGDIRSFLPDELLEQKERLFTRGHCSLFKNTKEVNAYYRTLPSMGCLEYRKVFQSDQIWCFDEWGEHCGGGISVIFKKNAIATYDEPVMADLRVGTGSFYVNRRPELGRVSCFRYINGTLWADYDGKSTSCLYCHFQKRRIVQEDIAIREEFKLTPPGMIKALEEKNMTGEERLLTLYFDIRRQLQLAKGKVIKK